MRLVEKSYYFLLFESGHDTEIKTSQMFVYFPLQKIIFR
jgi:hypothetical protein